MAKAVNIPVAKGLDMERPSTPEEKSRMKKALESFKKAGK